MKALKDGGDSYSYRYEKFKEDLRKIKSSLDLIKEGEV